MLNNIQSKRILIIDDEQIICEFLSDLLREMGHSVFIANDGLKGLAIYENQGDNIDLVLLDMGLPHINGIDCFNKLQKIDEKVNVLLYSGYIRSELVDNLFHQGLKGYIAKPFFRNDIVQAINKIYALSE